MQAPLSTSRASSLVWTVLASAGLALVALIATLPFGRPDPGDFHRFNGRIVANSYESETASLSFEEWKARWRTVPWQRFWTLRSPGAAVVRPPDPDTGSVALLWAPGVWLNRTFSSPTRLDLRWVGLAPRVATFLTSLGFALVAARLAGTSSRTASVAVAPLWVALLTASVYTSYYQSFLRESATLVFAGSTLVVVAAMTTLSRARWLALLAVSGSLLLWAAPAHGPLALPLAVLAMVGGRLVGHAAVEPRAVKRWLPSWATAAVLLAAGATSAMSAMAQSARYNAFNVFATIVLPNSAEPERLIAELGLPRSALEVSGHDAFEPQIQSIRGELFDRFDIRLLARALAAEPRVAARAAMAGASWMNRTSLSGFDLRAAGETQPRNLRRWNLFGELQSGLPLHGGILWLWLASSLVASSWVMIRGGSAVGPAACLAFASVACAIEIAVKVLGDGTNEKYRQLVPANLFLGATLCSALWVVLLIAPQPRSAPSGSAFRVAPVSSPHRDTSRS